MSSKELGNSFISRRSLLKTASCGFGYLAFAGLASELAAKETAVDTSIAKSPLDPRHPHYSPRAKRVIFLFMQGGPSHVDTFDHKPELTKQHGKSMGGSDGKGKGKGKLMASPFKFEHHGQSGLPISEIYPHLAKHADDLCLLNGMHTNTGAHAQATLMAHTGSFTFQRPSMGSWCVYGLGTENRDLPGFVTINPPARAQNYGSAFLPACYQGTRISGAARKGRRNAAQPVGIPNLSNPDTATGEQRRQIDLIQGMNRSLLERSGQNLEIDGVIESYELAFRMQSRVPEVMDLKRESEATLERYGIDASSPSANFGRQCLMARRFAESGVRFIEIQHGGWDQHKTLKTRLSANAAATDKPIAGLISDLKERGMLDDTLIIWGGEFGRTPQAQDAKNDGRRHNNRGYSMWLAGGGIQGGVRYGETDPVGYQSVHNKVHIHDLHATVLHQLGLDHEKLTYRYAGRDFRLTDVYGNVIHDIVS